MARLSIIGRTLLSLAIGLSPVAPVQARPVHLQTQPSFRTQTLSLLGLWARLPLSPHSDTLRMRNVVVNPDFIDGQTLRFVSNPDLDAMQTNLPPPPADPNLINLEDCTPDQLSERLNKDALELLIYRLCFENKRIRMKNRKAALRLTTLVRERLLHQIHPVHPMDRKKLKPGQIPETKIVVLYVENLPEDAVDVPDGPYEFVSYSRKPHFFSPVASRCPLPEVRHPFPNATVGFAFTNDWLRALLRNDSVTDVRNAMVRYISGNWLDLPVKFEKVFGILNEVMVEIRRLHGSSTFDLMVEQLERLNAVWTPHIIASESRFTVHAHGRFRATGEWIFSTTQFFADLKWMDTARLLFLEEMYWLRNRIWKTPAFSGNATRHDQVRVSTTTLMSLIGMIGIGRAIAAYKALDLGTNGIGHYIARRLKKEFVAKANLTLHKKLTPKARADQAEKAWIYEDVLEAIFSDALDRIEWLYPPEVQYRMDLVEMTWRMGLFVPAPLAASA